MRMPHPLPDGAIRAYMRIMSFPHIFSFSRRPTISVIRLQGVIAAGARAGLSDAGLAQVIERAFAKKPVAVALAINSPGGSPVQSALIAARIRRLSEEKKIPVHAFVEDVAASGGYWLATAGDDIWADASSLVGSIGVIHSSFGFPEFIHRHGIERRILTAGRSKSLADPFRSMTEADEARIRGILEPIHTNFIVHVTQRRGARLSEGADLFEGDVWVGEQAVSLGLADGIGHLVPRMKTVYGDKVRFRTFGPKRSLMSRLGMQAMAGIEGAIEERALWARYGL